MINRVAFRNPLAYTTFPIATYTIIGLNLILWFGLLGAVREDVFKEFALTPNNAQIIQMFTSLFLHSNLMHLVVNMLLLWLFGRKIELACGSVEFFFYYIGSGMAAALMHVAIVWAFMDTVSRTIHAVGSSGAIAGIMGIYAIRFYQDKLRIAKYQFPASIILLGWLAWQVVMGMTSLYLPEIKFLFIKFDLRSIGYWAHLGGFIFGMGIAQVSQLGTQAQEDYRQSDLRSAISNRSMDEVAQIYLNMAMQDPDDPLPRAEAARTFAILGNYKESIENYQIAIELYIKEKREDLAVDRFLEMRHAWPDAVLDTKLQFRMGCKLEEMGKYEQAIEILNQLSHTAVGAEAEISALRVGEIYLSRLNRPDHAISAFNRFLKMFPGSEWRHFAESMLAQAKENRPNT